jgi:outer membrane receptor protein involved in Fe transport
VGLATFFAGGISTAIHLGQGFRAPNIYDLSTVSNVPGGIVLPSPDLDPERSTTLEISARKSGHRASAGAAVYATRITGFIDRTPGSYLGDTLFNGLRVFRAANIGSAWIRGVELNGDARLTRRMSLRGQAFHTYGAQTSVDGGHEPVGRIPPLSGALSLRRVVGSAASGAWIEAGLRAAGPQDRLSARDERDSRIQAGGTPGYAVWMLRASTDLWGARLSGGLENVFDRGYREHGSGIDSPGRQLWLRIDLRNRER